MSGSNLKVLALGGGALIIGVAASAALAHPPLPGGRAGECFAEVTRPPVYRSVTETLPGRPIVSYREVPAVLGHGVRQVQVSPGRIEREIVPATYKTVPRWTEMPGRVRWVRDRPVYRLVTERQLISPEHLEWRRGSAAAGFSPAPADGYGVSVRPTGEVQCRVLVPARYALITRRVMVSPGGMRRVSGPARKVICYERVIATPARVIEHRIPAEYRTVQTTYVVHPARRERVVTPGPDRQVTRQVVAAPGQKAWAPIHCGEVRHPAGRAADRLAPPEPPAQAHGRASSSDPVQAPMANAVPPRPPSAAGANSAAAAPRNFVLPPPTPAPYGR